jgi:hypothetical protein
MLSGQSRRGTDFDDGRRGAIHSHRVANQEGDQTRLFLPFRHLFAHPESSRALSGTRHTTVDECLRKTHCILDISFRPALSLERRPSTLSALSTRICSSPCPTPLLPSQIYIRHRYLLLHRYADLLVAFRNYLSDPCLRHRDRHTRIFAVPACLSAPISTRSLRLTAPDARAITSLSTPIDYSSDT